METTVRAMMDPAFMYDGMTFTVVKVNDIYAVMSAGESIAELHFAPSAECFFAICQDWRAAKRNAKMREQFGM